MNPILHQSSCTRLSVLIRKSGYSGNMFLVIPQAHTSLYMSSSETPLSSSTRHKIYQQVTEFLDKPPYSPQATSHLVNSPRPLPPPTSLQACISETVPPTGWCSYVRAAGACICYVWDGKRRAYQLLGDEWDQGGGERRSVSAPRSCICVRVPPGRRIRAPDLSIPYRTW